MGGIGHLVKSQMATFIDRSCLGHANTIWPGPALLWHHSATKSDLFLPPAGDRNARKESSLNPFGGSHFQYPQQGVYKCMQRQSLNPFGGSNTFGHFPQKEGKIKPDSFQSITLSKTSSCYLTLFPDSRLLRI